ncbi:hypothetical protein HPB50_024254 [Hyalomma asiaticum]|uniref:Uncharacterized protein n=1 Tax=Hyalomma asiaticum TaxID=266040 RepID=A0ACB7SBC8_HYAAI|nr:hypothetical protein HPB50_024254 [Hyalomma asiaticum]
MNEARPEILLHLRYSFAAAYINVPHREAAGAPERTPIKHARCSLLPKKMKGDAGSYSTDRAAGRQAGSGTALQLMAASISTVPVMGRGVRESCERRRLRSVT